MFLVLSFSLFIRHLAGLRKNYQTDVHETQGKGVEWANLGPIKFWSGSESWADPQIIIHY